MNDKTCLSRRTFLGAGAALGALTLARPSHAAQQRPNVIIVMTDDQGYGDLQCHGNSVLETPSLNRLHAESTRLTNFHVSPTCAPTRAALMTGRYNNRVGVWHTIMGRSILQRGEQTMADYFADAGYRTGIFGKWHLGDAYPYRPQDRGFQEVLVHGGGGVGQTPDYWGNDYIDDTYFHNGVATAFKGYCTDIWFDGACRFIRDNVNRPFFCYLPTNAPHHPYIVPSEYSQPFKDRGVPEEQANFYGMLANFDENMGRLLQTLDDAKVADNTIVIYLTDNGTSAGDTAGMRGTKGSEYEGGHRVPCFIRWPEGPVAAGADIPLLAAHLDLLPTLLEWCGVGSADNASLDGISLCPWLAKPDIPAPERTIIVDSQRIDHPEKWRKSAVLDGDWRLINGAELYDVSADPAQKSNVAEQHPDRVAQLRAAYEAWWDSISPAFDTYCPMVIGARDQGVTHLTCHDWHGEQVPWHQRHIREGMSGNGFWAIDVATPGEYRFELRRWPVESGGTIRGAVPGGTAIPIVEARLAIAAQEVVTNVAVQDTCARFTLALEKGEARLNTAFVSEDGAERGAYYVAVERVSA